MKITLFLLIVCLTEIYANNRQIFKKCVQEYLEDYEPLSRDPIMTEEEEIRRMTPYKLGCISVICLKKQLPDSMPIKQYITDSLNKPHPNFTDADMTTYRIEINRCMEEAETDACKLLECLEPWSGETRISILIGIPPPI